MGSVGVGSLSVPNVQALAADHRSCSKIPERYIRPEIEDDPVLVDELSEIPVIDMSKLLDPQFSAEESDKLHLASQHWGFFQLVNHNIPKEIIERMKVDITEFFKLPLEEKRAFSQLPGNVEGYGQMFVVSDEQKLDWADMIQLNTIPITLRNMSLWPNQPFTFRDTLHRYSEELFQLTSMLLGLMAKNLGLNPETLSNILKEQTLRANYCPPCPQAEKALGISPHSDVTLITIVLQVNEVQGLQIKKNGAWIPVNPLADALIVNVGDRLEIFSNGVYKSIEHRVVVNREKERLSIASFHKPSIESMIGPHPEIVGDGKAKYETMNNGDLQKLFLSSKLDGKSLLDQVKLN